MGRYALDATLLDAYNETCDFYFQEEGIFMQMEIFVCADVSHRV